MDFDPDAFLANQPDQQAPAAPQGFDPDAFLSNANQEQYGTTGQQIGAGVEGLGKGFLGPVATGLELGAHKIGLDKALGVDTSAEAQTGRAEANPVTHGLGEVGGLGLGFLTGTGEAGLLAKGAGIASEAADFGKIGSFAIKGLIENAGIQAGDEASKIMLGQGDPESPVASALINTGYGGLMGAATGGVLGAAGLGAARGLKSISDSRVGLAAGDFLNDFGNRWQALKENPNKVDAVYKEVTNLFNHTNDLSDETWQSGGLKEQAIRKLLPAEMTDGMIQHAIDMNDGAADLYKQMVKDGSPRGVRNQIQQTMARYNEALNEAKTPWDYWDASNTLKKEIGEYVPWNADRLERTDPNYAFIKNAKGFYKNIQGALENTDTWGEAGDLQKGINSAWSKFKTPNDEFKSMATGKISGYRDIDPKKIKTYVNGVGKSGVGVGEELNPRKMKNYVEASQAFRDEVHGAYSKLGVQSPVQPLSLNELKNTYNEVTPGAKWAEAAYNAAIPKFALNVTAGTTGAGIGYKEGGAKGAVAGAFAGMAVPYLSQALTKQITHSTVPFVLRALSAGRPSAVADAIEHAQHVTRGASAVQNGINALFTGSRIGVSQAVEASSSDKEKIKKFIDKNGLDNQLQNTQHDLNQPPPMPAEPPKFAQGGDVQKPEAQVGKINHFAEAFPAQDMMLSTARSRVYNYLKTLKPTDNPARLPFDSKMPNHGHDRDYDKAVGLAAKPLSILNSVKEGTITTNELNHFKQMWPEIHDHLSKKMTDRLTQAQFDNEKPPYEVRQAMSLFLGASLDSSMTPQSIMAAQSVYAKAAAQAQQAPQKPKKGTGVLQKADQAYQTADQSRQERMQKG